jgi:hypothetical protein
VHARGGIVVKQLNEICAAIRLDGQPCEAPAIKGKVVCQHHGRTAREIRFAAERRRRQEALLDAITAWHSARGTSQETDALGDTNRARRDLEDWEGKLAELARIKAKARRAPPRAGLDDAAADLVAQAAASRASSGSQGGRSDGAMPGGRP